MSKALDLKNKHLSRPALSATGTMEAPAGLYHCVVGEVDELRKEMMSAWANDGQDERKERIRSSQYKNMTYRFVEWVTVELGRWLSLIKGLFLLPRFVTSTCSCWSVDIDGSPPVSLPVSLDRGVFLCPHHCVCYFFVPAPYWSDSQNHSRMTSNETVEK